MKELKTLKEIREKVYSQCKDEAEKRLLEYLFRLEDEKAINWVKSNEIIVCPEAEGIEAYKIKAIQNAIIKQINNLTEEDLK